MSILKPEPKEELDFLDVMHDSKEVVLLINEEDNDSDLDSIGDFNDPTRIFERFFQQWYNRLGWSTHSRAGILAFLPVVFFDLKS